MFTGWGRGELKSGGFRRERSMASRHGRSVNWCYFSSDSDGKTIENIILKWYENRLAENRSGVISKKRS